MQCIQRFPLHKCVFRINNLVSSCKQYSVGLPYIITSSKVNYIASVKNKELSLQSSFFLRRANHRCAALSSVQNSSLLSKYIHMANTSYKEIGYEEFLKLRKQSLTVIDVRNKDEIKSSGTIPGSLNIPLNQFSYAFSKSPDDFKAKYGRSKPTENQTVVFLCQRGSRSRNAMIQAKQMGYKNAVSIRGGWIEFSQNEK